MRARVNRYPMWIGLGLLALMTLAACTQVTVVPVTTTTPAPTRPTNTPAPPSDTPAPPSATPAPLTPQPTVAPTITPTPVIYTVQKGDTLGGIASKYSIPVEAIQAANGITDPRRLKIGQDLLIPMDESAPLEPPTPTPTPLAMEIAGINFQTSPSGKLWCFGEVLNSAGIELTQVEVAVSLFDDAGKELAAGTAFAELDVVPRGKRSPFAVAFDDPPGRFARYQAIPLRAQSLNQLGSYYLDLEILEDHGEPRGRNSYSVAGRVRNRGEKTARNIRVVITGYDEAGRVAAVREVAPAQDSLDPGRSSEFQINLLSTAGTVATYTLQAEGLSD
jgi:LysM repeat protein